MKKILIKYTDGTEKEITKGAVITMVLSENEEETTLNFEFTNFSKNDLVTLIYGVIEMGYNMGFLNENEEG